MAYIQNYEYFKSDFHENATACAPDTFDINNLYQQQKLLYSICGLMMKWEIWQNLIRPLLTHIADLHGHTLGQIR